MKILCSAAAEKLSFQRCLDIGRAVNDETVSIGSALDHCHVPGRQHQSVSEDVCVLGAGIHNEPGQTLIQPLPSVETLVDRCLRLLCDQSDDERAFVSFEKEDSVMLLINNYGGLSPLELGALTDEVQRQLSSKWDITPCRTLSGTFETSLNAPGFSVSLCNITTAARRAGSAVEELLHFFDRPTTAVSWPNTLRPPPDEEKAAVIVHNYHAKQRSSDVATIRIEPELLQKGIRFACEYAIAAEPKLTEWDMVMGDGDCGEAVKGLAESVIVTLDAGIASNGSVITFLASLIEAVDDMGGTLGAILGILLSAFLASLYQRLRENPNIEASSPNLYAKALVSAIEALKSHTSAREGDRTVMDVLLPFVAAFGKSGDFASAVRVANDKAEGTRFLKARFGRATYVGEAAGQQLPDPGAWAVYEILAGMAKGFGINIEIPEIARE